MKTLSTIQILFFVLVLAVAASSTAYSQDSIPPEKKRALHKFDPSDIFPEEREVGRTRKKKPKNDVNGAVPKTRSLELTSPEPEPTVAPRAVSSPRPSTTATEVEPTPTATPEASPEATATPSNLAAAQSSNLPSAGGSAGANQTGNGQTGSGQGFPIYFLIPLLFLSVFALVAMIISLKKQLRTP
ncbi:MAG: hypothetical protein J2P41_03415 [Blastocatellia bacterium]|nr:hypothetical protein [Blastocatellia bacterium]